MSEENGFVERPSRNPKTPSARTAQLIATADNGKAVVWHEDQLGSVTHTLRRYGLKGHIAAQPDGTYRAWCERIAP